MTTLCTVLWLVWLAKPLYWAVRYIYSWYKPPVDDFYYTKLQDWIKQTWNYVKWQKGDL